MSYSLKCLSQKLDTMTIVDFMTIGSDSSCHYQINGLDINPRHIRFEIRDNKPYLKDLRSKTGTFVNNELVTDYELKNADIIKIGSEEFQFFEQKNQLPFPLTSKNKNWEEELTSLGSGSKTDFPILILGASGTGKEIIADAIHTSSLRKSGPLICVNCSALTETLVESELFGHVKGSFTGAIQDRKGAFESARGGTLFLDEIGDLPYSLQAKLLRALENSEIRPVGSDRTIKTDVRIIAATHQNLLEKIQENTFRLDLYYRLNVIQVSPPELVNRMEDFDSLLGDFCRLYKVRFNFSALSEMKKYNWPGNIRELKNLVARASALFPYEVIDCEKIKRLIEKSGCGNNYPKNTSTPTPINNSPALPVIKEIEKQMIIKRLTANRGNQRLTANDLGMPKSTLHDRLKYYEINVEEFKLR